MTKNTNKAKEYAQEVKKERTVKVKTLIKAFAIVIVVMVAFVGGWVARSNDNSRVSSEASALVEKLSLKANQ